jgi:hypothetical protein
MSTQPTLLAVLGRQLWIARALAGASGAALGVDVAESLLYDKKRFSADSATWTPINVPITCSTFVLRNLSAVDVKIRTRVADPNTEDVLPPGSQEIVTGAPRGLGVSINPRFPVGSTVLFAQSASGVANLIGTFLL